MTRDEWQRVKAISAAALDRPEAERDAYVSAACLDDASLAREVNSLLAFTAKASDLFETGAFAPPAATSTLLGAYAGIRDSHQFEPGSLINGRYRVESVAGRGGMGAVYRVADTARSQTLALKTISGRARFINLFKVEFRTLVELHHPHLARSYDFEPIVGSDDYCFTMDFVEGRNIFDATTGASWREIVDMLVQMCRALAYIHNRGVVHRDIKPNNVLVQSDGMVKLLDFGLAGGVSESGQVMGTPAYLAPELMDRGRGDHRSDLYSLGILGYQLLCRRVPFSGVSTADVLYQHAYSPISWPDSAESPDWLKEIVVRLCAKEPSDRFRGANQVIEAINQLGHLDHPVETAATRESYVLSGRFVGREDQFSLLSTFVARRLADGAPRVGPVALVCGPSGVGKSRLISELRHELQLNRQTFVEGNCFEGAAAEYGPFAEALAQLVPLVETRGGAALVERSIGELVKVAPELTLTRVVRESSPLTTAEAERRRLFDTVATFLVDVGSLFPFVLYVNDLQWASQGTVEILRYLIRRVGIVEREGGRIAIALVGSYRDDETAGRPVEDLFAEISDASSVNRLEPLGPQPMRQLLQSMFGIEEIPEAFVARVLEDAAGSPFFLEEVVRALVENGSVFVEDGAWRTATAVGDLEIPATVVAALHRRLAMLASRPEQLRVLRLLAAYKKPMSAPLLSAIEERDLDLVQGALHDLSLRQMVVSTDGTERTYRTVHDHLRTTVYADLAGEAPALHLRIAHGLERVAADEKPMLSELAHHYWLAHEQDKALKYALLAGQSALSVYANEEAIEHLEHALMLLPAEWTQPRARTAEQLADAYFLAGHYQPTIRLLTDLEQNLEDPVDKTRVQRKLGEVIGYSAGTPHEAADIMWRAAERLGARRPASRAAFLVETVLALGRHLFQQSVRSLIPMARSENERVRLSELASIYLRISYFNFFGDPLLFFLPVLRAANVVDRIGEGKEHSNVYSMTAVALGGLGWSKRALRYGRDAIAEAARAGSPWHLANARSFHAIVLLQTGHWQQALEHAELARDSFAACGDHFQLAIASYHMLEVLHARGELRVAKARGRDEVAVFERLGLRMIGKGLYTVFGQILTKAGDEEGVTIGKDMLTLAERGADKLSTVFAHVALGDSLLQLGRIDEAVEHLERGLAIRDRNRFDVYLVGQGSALLAKAYADKIRSEGLHHGGALWRSFELRVHQAQRAGRRFRPLRSSAWLVRGLRERLGGRQKQAIACFEQAAQLAESQGARLWQADAEFEKGLAVREFEGLQSPSATTALNKALSLSRLCEAVLCERRILESLAEVG